MISVGVQFLYALVRKNINTYQISVTGDGPFGILCQKDRPPSRIPYIE